MDKGLKNLLMATSIRESILRASPMGMESTIGRMVVISRAISKME